MSPLEAQQHLIETSPEWELHHRAGDNSMFCYQRKFTQRPLGPHRRVQVTTFTIAAYIDRKENSEEWQCRLMYTPHGNMMVRLETGTFSWPNRNFPVFLERMIRYATACERA